MKGKGLGPRKAKMTNKKEVNYISQFRPKAPFQILDELTVDGLTAGLTACSIKPLGGIEGIMALLL